MTHSNFSTKPEIKNYLPQVVLEAACLAGNHEILYQFIVSKANEFEKNLNKYYQLKAINENDKYCQDAKDLVNDLNDLDLF